MTMPMYVPPEQLIKDRADFARKGIGRGRSIAVVEYDSGILLMGGNPSASLHKLSEIYDDIAFAGVGRFSEFETLRVAGIRYADLKGYAYGRDDVTAKGLANAYSQTLGQIFTHEVKPYEVEVMVVELASDGPNNLFRIGFDGTLSAFDSYGAMGGQDEELASKLGAVYDGGASLETAIGTTATAIEEVEEQSIDAHEFEAAVLDGGNGRRRFRRLAADEIAAARA
jgi:proteasome alpha subunit